MPVVIYTKATCPYCLAAKRLLGDKGVEFQEIEVTGRPAVQAEMREKSGGRSSVPQIFIDGHHVGGCDDLHELDEKGELDPMLEGAV